jgi:TIR domain
VTGGQGVAGVDFFVSHAGRDQAWAEWVAWHLVEAGYTVELDCWDWAAGENFVTRMHRAVDAANRVVALFSPAYFDEMRYTTQEWTSALARVHDQRLVHGGGVDAAAFDDGAPGQQRGQGCLEVVHLDREQEQGLGLGESGAQESFAVRGGDQGVQQAPSEVAVAVGAAGELLDYQWWLAVLGGGDHASGQVGLANTVESFDGDKPTAADVVDAGHRCPSNRAESLVQMSRLSRRGRFVRAWRAWRRIPPVRGAGAGRSSRRQSPCE